MTRYHGSIFPGARRLVALSCLCVGLLLSFSCDSLLGGGDKLKVPAAPEGLSCQSSADGTSVSLSWSAVP